jgi:hypothetical protein
LTANIGVISNRVKPARESQARARIGRAAEMRRDDRILPRRDLGREGGEHLRVGPQLVGRNRSGELHDDPDEAVQLRGSGNRGSLRGLLRELRRDLGPRGADERGAERRNKDHAQHCK